MNLNTGDTRLLIETCRKYGVLRNQAAYILATAYHETAHTMKPVREYGGEKYLKSKPYYPYVGMGYVQLTWLDNYKFAGSKLGVDFVKNPRLLLHPQHAAPILVLGMMDGWFTRGKHPLTKYVTLHKSDYRNARRGVNGTDKAVLIAGYAEKYEALLKAEGYGEATAPIPVPTPKPEQPTAPTPSKPSVKRGLGALILTMLTGGALTHAEVTSLTTAAIAVVAVAAVVGFIIWRKRK